jgi:REP element-mobilizing transposase RayT
MARKLRLEFAGAIYHVISRGNYRADVFGQDGTKQAFLGCLGEAAQKGNWVVHAWGVMSSHYHACIETLEPNLVSGMRWLQATFSLRFNRFRAEHGHVFLKALGKTADDLRSDKNRPHGRLRSQPR